MKLIFFLTFLTGRILRAKPPAREHLLGKPDLSTKDFLESDFKLPLNESRVGTYIDALETSDKPSAELCCVCGCAWDRGIFTRCICYLPPLPPHGLCPKGCL